MVAHDAADPFARGLELSLYPVSVQLNGAVSQTMGVRGLIANRVQRRFALGLTPFFNWKAESTELQQQLSSNFGTQVAEGGLMPTHGLLLSAEMTPFDGTVQVWSREFRYGASVNTGVGFAGTRHVLTSRSSPVGLTYGDAGTHLAGELGLGVRLELGGGLTLRIDVRDLMFSSRVSTIEGCDLNDVRKLRERTLAGQPPGNASVRVSCSTSFASMQTINAAGRILSNPATTVVSHLSAAAGLGWKF